MTYLYIKFWSIVANHLYFAAAFFWICVVLALIFPIVLFICKVLRHSPISRSWLISARALSVFFFIFVAIWPILGSWGVIRIYFSAPRDIFIQVLESWWWLTLASLPAIIVAIVHFWPLWWKRNLYHHWGTLLLGFMQEVTTFVIAFALSCQLFYIDGYKFLKNVVWIWEPQRRLTEILAEVSAHDDLPKNRRELLRSYQDMKEIKDFGRWCYFYRPEENDFYFVVQYSRLWFIYDRSGEVERTYRPRESSQQWQQLIRKCQWERWL